MAENRRKPLQVGELGRRDGIAIIGNADARKLSGNRNDVVGIVVRQRFEQHGVHDAEHRRVRADSQRERQDHDRRKSRIPQQQPAAVLDIAEQSFHTTPPASEYEQYCRRAN